MTMRFKGADTRDTEVSTANPLPQSVIGAASSSRIPSSAASVNATVAKASAGRVYMVNGQNAKAAIVFIKFYNKATAPTVGTDVPVLTLACPASAPFAFYLDGFVFSTGISYALTTDAADAGTTALLAADVLGLNVLYT